MIVITPHPNTKSVTPAEFDQFLTEHAHEDQIYELINGEIRDKRPCNTDSPGRAVTILPGFTLPLREIFPLETPDEAKDTPQA